MSISRADSNYGSGQLASIGVVTADGSVLFKGPMTLPPPPVSATPPPSPQEPAVVPLDEAEDGDVVGIADGSEFEPD